MADVGHFGCPNFDRPFWMSENHFGSHFWPFQIHTDPYAGGHFGCPQITFNRISIAFRAISDRYGTYFFKFFDEMAAGGHYGWDDNVIYRTRDIWMSNACVKYEERSLSPSKVIALTKLWRGGFVADENIIFPKTYVSREYKYVKRDQIWPFRPWKRPLERFKQTDFWQFISTLPGKLYAKIEKSYITVLEQMVSKCKKGQIWHCQPWKITLRVIQPNQSFDMWFMSSQRSYMPKKI